MSKVHRPHLQSGYIGKVDSQQTTDSDGQPDWIMLYQPGPKARAEYRAFTKRGLPTVVEIDTSEPSLPLAGLHTELERELIERGITPVVAAELSRDHPEEKILAQIERLDWLKEKKPEKIDDPAAYLVGAIKSDYAVPKGFVSTAERQRRAEAKQAKERQAEEERRRKQQEQAKAREEDALVSGYWDGLSTEQKEAHDATAIAQADAEELKLIEAGPMKRFGMTILRNNYTRKLLQSQGKLPPSPQ